MNTFAFILIALGVVAIAFSGYRAFKSDSAAIQMVYCAIIAFLFLGIYLTVLGL